ncbi:mannosyl-3-phosphoglycerate synthase [Podospora conica]|nr:mannosyl-3-phosphoglycerate synthase [Schizothecium conicum]
MRITNPLPGATIGLTTIMREAPVLELEAGFHPAPPFSSEPDSDSNPRPATFAPSPTALHAIHSQMAIIIPCKNEDPATLHGVLQGIPHPCTILLISASTPTQYAAEAAVLSSFCLPGRRRGLALHQRDPVASAALSAAGMASSLFDPATGAVRAGKGEGMILGTAVVLALFPQLRYIGFLDADAKVPGAPHEYCRSLSRGDDDDVMVRIHWGSKPKPRKDGSGGLDFGVAEGRSSRIVNEWMNRFVQATGEGGGGGEDKMVTTGNAGEHAMTVSLAKKLQFAGGYAIEPFHYVDLFVRHGVPGHDGDVVDTLHLSTPMTRSNSNSTTGSGSGGWTDSVADSVRSMATSSSSPDAAGCYSGRSRTPDCQARSDDIPLELSPVRVVQIKTINAHIHRETDDAHVRNMWKMGLGTLYHHLLPEYIRSPYVRQGVRERMVQLRTDMEAFVEANNREFGDTASEGQPLLPEPRVYPALQTLDMEVLRKMLESGDGSLQRFWF